MAVVARAIFERRHFGAFIMKSEENAGQFLAEADRDSVELYKLMRVAFGDVPEAEFPEVAKNRIAPGGYHGEERFFYKLCSKFIHPSSLVMHDMEKTIL